MGKKKYFCDFCNRSFNDDKNTRTKHLSSVGHLNLKKEHYNMFRDPEIILQEESGKKPCRKFHFEGFCPFGGSCTFSHYSREDLDIIRHDLMIKKAQESVVPTVDDWLMKYKLKQESKRIESQKLLWSHELPPELNMNFSVLPPSITPFHVSEFLKTDLDTWG